MAEYGPIKSFLRQSKPTFNSLAERFTHVLIISMWFGKAAPNGNSISPNIISVAMAVYSMVKR